MKWLNHNEFRDFLGGLLSGVNKTPPPDTWDAIASALDKQNNQSKPISNSKSYRLAPILALFLVASIGFTAIGYYLGKQSVNNTKSTSKSVITNNNINSDIASTLNKTKLSNTSNTKEELSSQNPNSSNHGGLNKANSSEPKKAHIPQKTFGYTPQSNIKDRNLISNNPKQIKKSNQANKPESNLLASNNPIPNTESIIDNPLIEDLFVEEGLSLDPSILEPLHHPDISKIMRPNLKKSKRSIGDNWYLMANFGGGSVQQTTHIQDNTNIHKDFLAYNKATPYSIKNTNLSFSLIRNPLSGLTFGATVEYSKHITEKNYNFTYNEVPVIDARTNKIVGYIELNEANTIQRTTKETETHINMPLDVGYNFQIINRLSIGVKTGVLLSYLNSVEGNKLNCQDFGLENLHKKDYKSLLANPLIGVRMQYQLGSNWLVSVESNYIKGMSGIQKDNNSVYNINNERRVQLSVGKKIFGKKQKNN